MDGLLDGKGTVLFNRLVQLDEVRSNISIDYQHLLYLLGEVIRIDLIDF